MNFFKKKFQFLKYKRQFYHDRKKNPIYFHFCEILQPKKNLVINQPTSQNWWKKKKKKEPACTTWETPGYHGKTKKSKNPFNFYTTQQHLWAGPFPQIMGPRTRVSGAIIIIFWWAGGRGRGP